MDRKGKAFTRWELEGHSCENVTLIKSLRTSKNRVMAPFRFHDSPFGSNRLCTDDSGQELIPLQNLIFRERS